MRRRNEISVIMHNIIKCDDAMWEDLLRKFLIAEEIISF